MTGATGFTGGHLAQHLITHGDEVRALVRSRSRERFDRSALPASGVKACDGDLMDAASLRRAVDGVDVVYHIAATYREAGQPDSAYRAINVEGTRNILEAAKAANVTRVVHCSTGGVHGHIEHPPANEDARSTRRRLRTPKWLPSNPWRGVRRRQRHGRRRSLAPWILAPGERGL